MTARRGLRRRGSSLFGEETSTASVTLPYVTPTGNRPEPGSGAREAALGGFGDPGDEATGWGSRVHDRPPGGDTSRKRHWGCRPSPGGALSRATAVCARTGPRSRRTEVAGFRGSEQGPRKPSPGRARALRSILTATGHRGPEGGVLAAHIQCLRSGQEGRQNPLRVPLTGRTSAPPRAWPRPARRPRPRSPRPQPAPFPPRATNGTFIYTPDDSITAALLRFIRHKA